MMLYLKERGCPEPAPAVERFAQRYPHLYIDARDGEHRAGLTETDDGVLVEIWRQRAHTRDGTKSMPQLIHALTIDAPFHVVRDGVHDALRDGEI